MPRFDLPRPPDWSGDLLEKLKRAVRSADETPYLAFHADEVDNILYMLEKRQILRPDDFKIICFWGKYFAVSGIEGSVYYFANEWYIEPSERQVRDLFYLSGQIDYPQGPIFVISRSLKEIGLARCRVFSNKIVRPAVDELSEYFDDRISIDYGNIISPRSRRVAPVAYRQSVSLQAVGDKLPLYVQERIAQTLSGPDIGSQ